jgi:hypothetical protein
MGEDVRQSARSVLRAVNRLPASATPRTQTLAPILEVEASDGGKTIDSFVWRRNW